jgi:tungstate transport system substrate-binding protein
VAGCQSHVPSTQDSGLLDVLIPRFEQATRIKVKVVAVGSGQAMELGRRGDADLLLTHAPKAELQFMSEGFGDERIPVMKNDFVLVGPDNDPAEIQRCIAVTEAFERIATHESPFVSRADDSGTHQKEMAIWREGKIDPEGTWYLKAGAGMAPTLRIAAEKRAYTLSDRATYLAQRNGLDLVVLLEKDTLLNNPYSAIIVSPKKHPHVHYESARHFVRFLIEPETQKIIAEFGIAKYGQPLFFVEN